MPTPRQNKAEPVHFNIKASPKAVKRMDDLAKSLGTTTTVLISSGIEVYYEIMKQLLEQGGGKLYVEDLEGNTTEIKVLDD